MLLRPHRTDEAARGAMLEAGLSPWLAGQIVNVWREMRSGPPEGPTGTVRALLGREPRTIDEFCADHTDRFTSAGDTTNGDTTNGITTNG